MRKYHYFRSEDANRYLSGTIIFHKETKKPLYVSSIQAGQRDRQFINYSAMEADVGFAAQTQEEFLADKFEIRNFPSLGYLNIDDNNIGTKAFYLARRPLRDVKQGLYTTNVIVHNPPPQDKRITFRTILDNLIYTRPLLKMFEDDYPHQDEIHEKINDKGDKKLGMFSRVETPDKVSPHRSLALNKKFAVAAPWKDGQNDSNVLLYKQDEIGLGNLKYGFKLDDKFKHLKETVEDARIRLA